MKILLIGLGSMGRRRIRLLKQISAEINIIGVDSREDRRRQAEEEFGICTMEDLDKAFDGAPDCIVVSTSPLAHAAIIKKGLEHNCHVFTELNLVNDGYDSNIQLAAQKQRVLFLSSTFLYRDEICYIKDRVAAVEGNKGLNYTYHVGQYLPDWHPWESVKDYFVGDKRTNGCRELMAIEFPWILKVFGDIDSYEVISGHNTDLPVQYADNYMMLIRHKNGNKGCFCVDVMSRKAVRNLEVYGEQIYLTWDGTPLGLKDMDISTKEMKSIDLYETIDKQEGYESFVIENAYKTELETFLGMVKGEGSARYTFEEDLKVLAMIDSIEGGE